DDGQRQQHGHLRLGPDEAAVGQRLHQPDEGRAGPRLHQHAQQRGAEEHAVARGVAEQAAVDRPDRLPGGTTQDCGSGAVAMAMRRKPSWASASWAVTTAWYGVRASARSITGSSRSSPAAAAMACFTAS